MTVIDTQSARMRSIGDIAAANRGLGPGFDFLRIALALSVVGIHAETVATGNNWFSSRIMWMPEYIILVMFFALSGFLITGSAQRLSLQNFMINRGMRIFPALIIEILLSALVLGAAFTTLSLQEYYTNGLTWHYLTNIFGWINYKLPGVFKTNPKDVVNGSLWTVPCELGCYAIMASLMISKLVHRRRDVLAITGFFIAMGFIVPLFVTDLAAPDLATQTLGPIFVGRGSKLYVAFLLGIVCYLYRDRLPYSPRIFVSCVLFCAALSLLRPAPWMTVPLLNLIVAPIAVYMTIFIGNTRIPGCLSSAVGITAMGFIFTAIQFNSPLGTHCPGQIRQP